jgi:putative membrane protein
VVASKLAGAWGAPPFVLAGAVLAVILFAQAYIRLRRRGRPDLAGWDRPVLFGLGLAALVLPLVSPLDVIGDDYLLSAHMLQHVLIGDLAPALLVLAVRGPLCLFLLPPAVLRPLAGVRPLRATLSFLLRPVVSLVVWAAVMLAWHVPSAYDYVLTHPLVHDLEHVSFVFAGTLAWTQLIDPAHRQRLRVPGRILFGVAMIVLMHPVMDSMLFSTSALYPSYADQAHRLWGISPLTDQRLAGAIMMVEQLLTVGTCIGVLLWPYLKRRRESKLAHESA